MNINRRFFCKLAGVAAAALPGTRAAQNDGERQAACLVDTTRCIGCRACEQACNRRNRLPQPNRPFSDPSVFESLRRPSEAAFTVVNRYPGSPSPEQAELQRTFCKVQCLHCLHPACVSACIVGALRRLADGAVVYNSAICIGCRYCLIACPFQIPAYEYRDPLTPRVRKCEFCADWRSGRGADPACAAACPTEAIVFGRRADLLRLARQKIEQKPKRYTPWIYGEREAGGTSWLYLNGRPAAELDLLPLPSVSPARQTEAIQHGVYRFGIIPLLFYGFLGGWMWLNRRRRSAEEPGNGGDGESPGSKR